MKLGGYFNGIPWYSFPDCPEGIVYFISGDIKVSYPKKKDGSKDMRYKINQIYRLLHESP